MKIIKMLSERVEEELEDAEFYSKNAVFYKTEKPGLAKVFYEISLEEMRHVDMLHNEVKEIIEKYRREHGDPPVAMLAVYEYLHEKDIEWANEIRGYQAEYKNV